MHVLLVMSQPDIHIIQICLIDDHKTRTEIYSAPAAILAVLKIRVEHSSDILTCFNILLYQLVERSSFRQTMF